MASAATTSRPHRSAGIKIVCGFGAVSVLAGLFAVALYLLAGQLVWSLVGAGYTVALGASLYGLWNGQPWGWVGSLVVHGVGTAHSIYEVVLGDISALAGVGVGILFIAIVYRARSAYF